MDQLILDGVPLQPKKRGRPVTGNALTSAERKRRQRDKHGLVVLSVEIPASLLQAIDEYMKFKDLTKSQVIEKLLTTQLLRKR